MNTLSDWELIRTFAEKQSNAAFTELVHRHLGLVYASALRQVHSPDLASDVAQAVFLLLARKAPTLPSKVVLSGWLFRSTRFIAARVIREENRRHRREQEAAEMNLHGSNPENELWTAVEPHLDDALAALGEKDRQVVLLRFLEGKRIREVGELLGLGEDAAKKRVSRAIEKLRTALGRRGVAVPALTLAGVLACAQAHAAPAGLAQAIGTTTAATVAKTSVAALVAGAARDWLWLKVRAGLALGGSAAAIVILSGTLWAASRGPVATSDSNSPLVTATQNPGFETQNSKLSASPLPTRPASAAAATAKGRKILLTALDKESDEPIVGAQVITTMFDQKKWLLLTNFTTPDGICEVNVPDVVFSELFIWLTASNHVPMTIWWQSHELIESTTLHTSHLARGITMKGKVVDEEGHPVSGARVGSGGSVLEGTQRENPGSPTPVMTDDEGRFQSDQMPSDYQYWGMDISVYSTNFASTEFNIRNSAELATNRIVVLTRGVSVYGHVLNAQGTPIGNAKLEEGDFDTGKQVRTSPDGSFEITHLGPGTHEWAVGAKGFIGQQLHIPGTTNAPEIVVTLQEKKSDSPQSSSTRLQVHLVGSVVDAQTGEPIPSFKVLEAEGNYDPQLLGESAAGHFDWTAQIYANPGYSLQVEADGYLPAISDMRSNAVDPQKYDFRLQHSTDLTGVILQPDGQPAGGAIVGLLKHEDYVHPIIRGTGEIGRFWRPDAQTVADKTGRFSLHPQLGASRIVASHQSGFIIVPADSATNVYISLKPWGKVEGILLVAQQPAHNQIVDLDVPATASKDADFEMNFQTTTDIRGHFVFTNVPPGTFQVKRWLSPNEVPHVTYGSDRKKKVTVLPGETAQVSLGNSGRVVTGKIVLSPVPDFDWSIDSPALVVPHPDLREPHRQDFKNAFDFQTARDQYTDQLTQYFLALQPDGTFRAEDVPPGTYELQLKVTKVPLALDPTALEWDDRLEMGRATSTVTIPDSDSGTNEPVDLGTITVPINTNSKP